MACFFLALKMARYSSGTRSRNSRATRPRKILASRGLAIGPPVNFICGPTGAKKSYKLYLHREISIWINNKAYQKSSSLPMQRRNLKAMELK